MNIYTQFRTLISNAVLKLELVKKYDGELSIERISVEPPRDQSHGDIATNAAMLLAKPLGTNPRALASELIALLENDPAIENISIAGPGFINIKLSAKFWESVLSSVLTAGEKFGRGEKKETAPINVEYVSANPTGPLHVGHCRGAVVGDALASLLAFSGHEVVREYYINDAGSQIDVLAKSAFLRYRESLGETIGKIPEGLYPGDYLVPVGGALKEKYGDALLTMDEAEWLPIVKDFSIDAMMDLIRDDLAGLNVNQEVFFSERTLHGDGENNIANVVEKLRADDHVYVGKIPPPKGKLPDDWEEREQTLFRSTAVGDDIDRALMKSDGTYTYFAADVAYFYDKFSRGFGEMIFILGADHGGYVKRLEAVARAVAGDKAKATVLLCQLVKLYKGGQPFTMSKRAGNFVTVRDVVEEVGSDAIRFMMLYRKSSEPLDFDFAKVTEQSKENPIFYVQYAHARCHSVFRQAAAAFPDLSLDEIDFKSYIGLENLHESEMQVIAKLAEFPRVIDNAAGVREPHRVAFYLYDLASTFHSHWNKGKDLPELRFINDKNRQLSLLRLGLVQAVATVLKSGLQILGTSAPDEMR